MLTLHGLRPAFSELPRESKVAQYSQYVGKLNAGNEKPNSSWDVLELRT
jgi:hypothetical protein